ncbi:hypothetical protein [Actinomadura rupiterrae]|uniref:hypothetical protein n=1 Tax=Actinomadura rupiterrae TaxID=559627 RepID=UPI0020A490F9|nr:hypothetical protein [Actinomadura rupiterrae]MCP2335256.1 hypothetical protein [Actinomadura rupiterrae]
MGTSAARGRVAASAAALLAAGSLAAGCGGSDAGASSPPALTRDQARQVVASYAGTIGEAGSKLDASLLPKAETDPQLAMDTAAVKLRRAAKAKTGTLKLSHVNALVPRLSGYPRWFAADAVSGTGKEALRHALLFTQEKAGAPWLLASDPFPTDAALSRVTLDRDGYAASVAPSEGGLAIAPDKLAAAHATLLNEGPKAAGASKLAPGPKTTEAFAALRQAETGLQKDGITLASRFEAGPGRVYALRTRDGGALVWYVLKQREAYSAVKKGKLSVTGDLVGLAPPSSVSTRMDTTVLVQYLASVPAKGRAAVTGMYRKAVAATGH